MDLILASAHYHTFSSKLWNIHMVTDIVTNSPREDNIQFTLWTHHFNLRVCNMFNINSLTLDWLGLALLRLQPMFTQWLYTVYKCSHWLSTYQCRHTPGHQPHMGSIHTSPTLSYLITPSPAYDHYCILLNMGMILYCLTSYTPHHNCQGSSNNFPSIIRWDISLSWRKLTCLVWEHEQDKALLGGIHFIVALKINNKKWMSVCSKQTSLIRSYSSSYSWKLGGVTRVSNNISQLIFITQCRKIKSSSTTIIASASSQHIIKYFLVHSQCNYYD